MPADRKLGVVRPVAPGVTVQGVIHPDEGAVSFLLNAGGTDVEIHHGQLTAAAGALLACGADTRTAARRSLGLSPERPLPRPAHLQGGADL